MIRIQNKIIEVQIQKLIHKSVKGDRRAQKQFFELYVDRLYAISKRYAVSSEMAEETLFQAFLQIFLKLNEFKFINEAALFVWLSRIVINQVLMNRRKELNTLYKIETINEEHYNLLYFEEPDNESLIYKVNQLPEGYKTVFMMYVVDGFSHKEIAETLGISESTSRTQFFKARKLLQRKLNYNYEEFRT